MSKAQSKTELNHSIGYTLHINNLSFKVDQETLRKYCEEHFGEVKQIHIALNEKGLSKGYAFVEFNNEV